MSNRLNKEDHLTIEAFISMSRAFLTFKPEDFIKAHNVYKNRRKKLKKAYEEADIALDKYKRKVEEQ